MATDVVPGEINPDTLTSLPREQLIGLMREPLRPEFRRIEALVHEDERRCLLTEHDIGRRVSRLRDDAKYGNHAVALVAAACGEELRRLYRAAQFYRLFPNRKEVEKLMARRGEGGYRFGWAHVLQLLPVENPDRRAELIEVSFRDSLTVRQLAEMIPANHDNKAGRTRQTILLPRSLSGGLNQLAVMTTKLREKFRTTLPECVLPHLAELPPEQINRDVVARVARVREELTGLAREAAEGAAELTRLEQELARRAGEAPDRQSPPSNGPANETKATTRPGPARRTRSRRPVEA